jgi:hypothetical protein
MIKTTPAQFYGILLKLIWPIKPDWREYPKVDFSLPSRLRLRNAVILINNVCYRISMTQN